VSDGRGHTGARLVVAEAVHAVAFARCRGRAVRSHALAFGAALEVRAALLALGTLFRFAMMRCCTLFGGTAIRVRSTTRNAHGRVAIPGEAADSVRARVGAIRIDSALAGRRRWPAAIEVGRITRHPESPHPVAVALGSALVHRELGPPLAAAKPTRRRTAAQRVFVATPLAYVSSWTGDAHGRARFGLDGGVLGHDARLGARAALRHRLQASAATTALLGEGAVLVGRALVHELADILRVGHRDARTRRPNPAILRTAIGRPARFAATE